MKAQPFVVTPKDYDPALNVLGIKKKRGHKKKRGQVWS